MKGADSFNPVIVHYCFLPLGEYFQNNTKNNTMNYFSSSHDGKNCNGKVKIL